MNSHFLRLASINILLLVLFCSKGLLAQEIISTEMPPVISASPQLKAFEQYGSYGVSEFTGVPNINLPLWTIKSGSLEIPLSLSYFAGGIKVDELSGLYGLKWTLNAGGSISRSTMGNLDDGIYGWLNDDNKLPDDF
ncbi:MAG: hypothetical protein GX587_05555, partial [Bacteroidales bacterium]|nr:hypothetical protein [Bacteroidales bacterium]